MDNATFIRQKQINFAKFIEEKLTELNALTPKAKSAIDEIRARSAIEFSKFIIDNFVPNKHRLSEYSVELAERHGYSFEGWSDDDKKKMLRYLEYFCAMAS